MQPITRTKPSLRPAQPALPIAFVCFGLLLLMLAAPSLRARMNELSGNTVRQDILDNKGIDDSGMESWILSRKRALASRETAETLNDLALATMMRFHLHTNNAAVAKNDLKEALILQRLALARAPANAYGWARLAYMHIQTEGLSPTAAAALTLSLQTGPYEPSLMLSRLSMAILMLNKLDDDTKTLIPSMIRMSWDVDPDGLAVAAQRENFVSMVEHALRDDQEALASFREHIAPKEETSGD